VRVRPVVGADETRLRIVRDKSGKTKNGFVWTFNARDDDGGLDVAYVFAEDRSGSTPKTLLEGTKGLLLVDGYSGYNVVDEVSTRRRAACHAHLRRYFHEALPTAPVAQEMLDLVAELYIAEHAADEQQLVGRAKLDFRKQRAGPVRTRMRRWLDAHRERHPPKSPIGAAIRYADNQWKQLGVFLDDERVPLDNNGSERALRRVALLARGDLRGAPDQSLRVPHRRPRPRAGSSRERHRCAAARRLDRRRQRRLTGLRPDGDGRTVAVKTYYRERLRCKGRPSAEPRSATRASASAKSAATPRIRRSRARRPRSSRSA
jgi:hypothetical protein